MPGRFIRSQWMVIAAAVALSACRSPLESGKSSASLQKTLSQAIARELESLEQTDSEAAPSQATTRPAGEAAAELAHRRDELEAIGPLGPGSDLGADLGRDLSGVAQATVSIGLGDAISSAVRRNLGVEAARLQPGISAAEVIAAEAAFDALLFANADLTKIDQPSRVPVINGIPLGTPFTASETYRFETGLRQRFTTSTEAFISTDITRFRNRAAGITFSPDPAYTAAVRLGLSQPLLRDFGTDVTTATIRLSRNQQQRDVEQLRRSLLDVVADTERAYWDLVFAWRNLVVAEWLVEQGVAVRDLMERRRELDTLPAQYSDAVARVEQRRAEVIRARRAVRAASDRLKGLMNQPEATVTSEAVLYPTDSPVDAPIEYNLREAVLTAIEHRPEAHQAASEIDDAAIRERVARNQRLPLLDAAAEMAFVGLSDSTEDAYDELGGRDFIDYVLALTFEYPLGNRAAEAILRQARLQRSSAVIRYQRTVQDVILQVKGALRDVITNFELIEATRSFRIAQAENLRTLMVEEETIAELTPEFLNLKFQRQETLAEARRQEVQALVNFGKSLADLYRAMGIGLRMKSIDVEVEDDREPGPAFE